MILAANPVQLLLCYALTLFLLSVLAVVILSWFPLAPGGPMASVWGVLRRITDPVLLPLRRVIPPVGGMLDLTPTIVLIVGFAVRQSICP